jgi:hypothetical protein
VSARAGWLFVLRRVIAFLPRKPRLRADLGALGQDPPCVAVQLLCAP